MGGRDCSFTTHGVELKYKARCRAKDVLDFRTIKATSAIRHRSNWWRLFIDIIHTEPCERDSSLCLGLCHHEARRRQRSLCLILQFVSGHPMCHGILRDLSLGFVVLHV